MSPSRFPNSPNSGAYRESHPRSDGGAAPPRELVVSSVDRSRRGTSGFLTFQIFTLPLVVGAVLGALTPPPVALGGFLLSVVGCFVWWKRAPHAGTVMLRVDGDALLLLSANGKRETARFALKDVDVTLDTKTIQRVQEGDSAIPAMRLIDARVGPEVDTARILIEGGGKKVPLSSDHVAHMEASEHFGKIRVFLRKHGWVPHDERDAPPSSS